MPVASRAAYHKRNLGWPLAWVGGQLRQVTLAERYESAIRHLLHTPLNSLYYAPDYGTIVYRLRTQGANPTMIDVSVAQLRQVCGKYIPDVQIIDLVVEWQDDEQKLKIVCIWLIRDAEATMHGDLAGQRQSTVLV